MQTERSYMDHEELIAQARESALRGEDNHYPKPPLGAKPFGVVAIPRVNELLSAIGRYINEPNLTRDLLDCAKLWAKELEEQLDLIDTMLIYK